MTYTQALQEIHSRKAFSSCASLERIKRLMEQLGNPQEQISCVHVAGTNGKGSVCALVESALRAAGYRVGLFTSPYLVDFRERIQIDRQPISEERLVSCYESVMNAELALEEAGFEPVNEFELVTALGFVAFSKAQVDYAVIEVGLGGRCDATNVISKPAICCITPISLDHTAVLGHTVAEIALEKAGIMKPGCPVVLARQSPEAREILLHHGEDCGSSIKETEECTAISCCQKGIQFRYRDQELSIPLLGRYQMDNAAAAWEVCRLLGLEPETIRAGFSRVSWPGRLQWIPGQPDILIDAGHNPAGVSALCETLDELVGRNKIIAVMAMMKDKDYKQCIPMVARRCTLLIAATVSLPRSLSPEELAAEAAPYCETMVAETVQQAICLAKKLAEPGQILVICGSVYAAGEALKTI